jgi:hypothetical protein
MHYSKYFKDLGISRWNIFKLTHWHINTEFERFKYGTSYHEMWSLDTVLCCEIYPRLKHLYEKYHYQCDFADHSINAEENSELYEQIADERFKKVLWALETHIKIYFGIIDEEIDISMFGNPDSQYNKIKEGFKILGEGIWGVGV